MTVVLNKSQWTRCLLLLLLSIVCDRGLAQEMRFRVPILTVLVSPETVHVQQQIVQQIRLESNFPFDSMRVDLGQTEDAQVIELQAAGTREFKTWANAGWVYESSRAIFVSRSGPFQLPAVNISGTTLLPDGRQQPFSVRSEAVSLDVAGPALAMVGEPWIVADKVEMAEKWSAPPDLLRAGQIATRTILVRAHGVTGEHLADLTMPVSLGSAVLPGATTRRTEHKADTTIGILEQDFEVRILSDSKTDISAVQMPWWDATANALKRSAVRAYRIEPLPANVEQIIENIINDARQAQLSSARRLMWLMVGGAVLIAALAMLLLLFTPVRRFAFRWIGRISQFLFGPAVQLPVIGLSPRDRSGRAPATGPSHWHHPQGGREA